MTTTKTIGFRATNKEVRFAVVVRSNNTVCFLNATGETRLRYPAIAASVQDKLRWLYSELEQIWQTHKDTRTVAIKTNEYGLSDTKSKRESYFAEGVITLYFARRSINVDIVTYGSLPASSKDVREIAESRVGRSTRYWDSRMADAVLAAWKSLTP